MVSQIGGGHCLFKIEFLEKDDQHKLHRMESIVPLEALARPEMEHGTVEGWVYHFWRLGLSQM